MSSTAAATEIATAGEPHHRHQCHRRRARPTCCMLHCRHHHLCHFTVAAHPFRSVLLFLLLFPLFLPCHFCGAVAANEQQKGGTNNNNSKQMPPLIGMDNNNSKYHNNSAKTAKKLAVNNNNGTSASSPHSFSSLLSSSNRFSPLLLGWSHWSEWSACSAKCGQPGVQFQVRRCLDMYCSGSSSSGRPHGGGTTMAHGQQQQHQTARHRVCRAELKDCPHSTPDATTVVDVLALECALRSTSDNPLLPPPKLPQNCSQLWCLSASSGQLIAFAQRLRDGQTCQLFSSSFSSSTTSFAASAAAEHHHSQQQKQHIPTASTQQQQQQSPPPNAVCLHGHCEPVGCDQLIGSHTQLDQCGVCGGDGRSCASKLFRWQDNGKHFSPCDKSCGTGSVRVSVSICVNVHTQRTVPDRMCADQQRPRPLVRKCPDVVCPENTSWLTGDWSDCSVSCGLGEQQRDVFCAEQQQQEDTMNNNDVDGRSTKKRKKKEKEQKAMLEKAPATTRHIQHRRVADQYCWHTKRPIDVRQCGSAGSCPQWAVGDWSQCQAVEQQTSMDCDGTTSSNSVVHAIRRRPVECRSADGLVRYADWQCLERDDDGTTTTGGGGMKKPAEEQPCWTSDLPPPSPQLNGQQPSGCGRRPAANAVGEGAGGIRFGEQQQWQGQQQGGAIVQSYMENAQANRADGMLELQRMDGGNVVAGGEEEEDDVDGGSQKPRFVAGPWAQCSTSCGPGIQSRPVHCMARQAIGSAQLLKLPYYECQGRFRPAQFRPCQLAACPPHVRLSASSSAIRSLAQPFPATTTNQHVGSNGNIRGGSSSSTFRWTHGQWSLCSSSCLGGRQTAPVKCLELSTGQIVDEAKCEGAPGTGPKPGPLVRICNRHSCPPDWEIGPWSACSHSCGAGLHTRRVRCVRAISRRLVAGGGTRQAKKQQQQPPFTTSSSSSSTLILLPDAQCPGQRPIDEEPCALVDCEPEWRAGNWGQCSTSCGIGEQRRQLHCVRRNSLGVLKQLDAQQCSGSKEISEEGRDGGDESNGKDGTADESAAATAATTGTPATVRLCNLGPCPTAVEQQQSAAPDSGASSPPAALLSALSAFSYSEPASSGGGSVNANNGMSNNNNPPPPRQQKHVQPGKEELVRQQQQQTPPQSLALVAGPSSSDASSSSSMAKDQPIEDIGGKGDRQQGNRIDDANAEEKSGNDDDNVVEREQQEHQQQQKHEPRRLTLHVGGLANLYEGTSVKVKCPVAGRERRQQLFWTKNGRPLRQTGRIKISQNGALRIFRARQKDAGLYACQTLDGREQGNVTLRFKPDSMNDATATGGGNGGSKQLLQRVRDSLFRLGEHSLYHRLAAMRDPGQIRVDFAQSDWGYCEQPDCAQGEGVQARLLKCQIHVGHEAAYIEDTICEAFGVPRPAATRSCLSAMCPRWQHGPWSECADSRCVRQATAVQRRDVRCVFGNGTEAGSSALCPRKMRPKLKRECQNVNCSAEWRPSIWGECSRRCGDGGVQMRLLRCVWHGTRKPAGSNCEPARRPAAIRACQSKQPLPECASEDNNGTEKDEATADDADDSNDTRNGRKQANRSEKVTVINGGGGEGENLDDAGEKGENGDGGERRGQRQIGIVGGVVVNGTNRTNSTRDNNGNIAKVPLLLPPSARTSPKPVGPATITTAAAEMMPRQQQRQPLPMDEQRRWQQQQQSQHRRPLMNWYRWYRNRPSALFRRRR